MKKTFTQELTSWIFWRFTEINCDQLEEKKEAQRQMANVFKRLLDYPKEGMDDIDFAILQRVEEENDQLSNG